MALPRATRANAAPKKVPRRPRRARSIRFRVTRAVLSLMVAMYLLLYGGILQSGLLKNLDRNSQRMLQKTVTARADYLQYDMVNRWCDMTAIVKALVAQYDALAADGVDAATLAADPARYNAYLNESITQLVPLMRTNKVTGAFVALRTGELPADETVTEQLPAVYLRDRDPVSSYNAQNTDLLLKVAPLGVLSGAGIAGETGWQPMLRVSPADPLSAMVYNPYRAALEYPNLTYTDVSYWSEPYMLEGDSLSAISYSVPLVGSDGTLFGVLGIDVLTEYIARQLPYEEIGERGGYALFLKRGDDSLTPVAVSGSDYRYSCALFDTLEYALTKEGFYEASARGMDDLAVCVSSFSLYNTNAPYSDEVWYLAAAEPMTSLQALSATTGSTLMLVMLVAIGLSMVLALIFTRQLVYPIARLEKQVRTGTSGGPLQLTRAGIKELDSLADGVEAMNAEVRRNAGKLSRILEMSSVSLGAFELDTASRTVFASRSFFRVFGDAALDCSQLTYNEFIAKLHSYDRFVLPDSTYEDDRRKESVYEMDYGGDQHWARLKVVQRGDVFTGFAEDVSIEWREMRKLEFERDHDALTGIYNRRAFYEKFHALFDHGGKTLGTAALVMIDLDNLKYINDTYGHDFGDRYIRTAALTFAQNIPAGTLVARMSGDEFLLFFFGYLSRAEVEAALAGLRRGIAAAFLALPGGGSTPLRASAGIAWYPDNTVSGDMLLRYADFAMYKGKHSTKGVFVNFDPAAYRAEAYLLEGKEALNQLIEQQLVRYFFQPIIELRTGRVLAYEALMRPQSASLQSPLDVLTLARQESKLGAVERMTWFCAMSAFADLCKKNKCEPDALVFINSISNQILSDEELDNFAQQFRPYLPRLVMEHTEEEQSVPGLLQHKVEWLRRVNAHLALDDYGSGYNGESILVASSPDFVKVDVGIIRGVDSDDNKRQLIDNLVYYAAPRHIRIIAEGVETEAEYRALAALGVDCVQGYFAARPAAEPLPLTKECAALVKELSEAKKTE